MGKLSGQWEASNGTFRIRVNRFSEGNPAHFLEPGIHFTFESLPNNSANWVPITNAYFAYETNVKEISRDHVRFVNDKVGYIYLQYWMALTVDGGRSWSFWRGPEQLPNQLHYRVDLIQSVEIRPDGSGIMILNPKGVRDGKPMTLRTADFGRSWRLNGIS